MGNALVEVRSKEMRKVETFKYVFDDNYSITVMESQMRKGDILELEKLHGRMTGFGYEVLRVEVVKDGEQNVETN